MMKRFLSLIALLAFGLSSYAQISIDSARSLPIGSSVTVTGIVTNGDELGGVRYMQDATAGIACYPGSGSVTFSVDRADSITVSGTIKDYNGLLEIDPITAVTVHSNNNVMPDPLIITIPQMGEPTEALLVRLNGVSFSSGGGTFSSGTYAFTDAASNSGNIYIRSGHPLIGELIPVGPFDLIGLMAQFTFTGFGGYQILPRDTNDMVFSSSIMFASGLELTSQSTNSLDFAWLTSTNGSTNCKYGLTPALELGEMNNGGSTNSHSLSISGLSPGNIYYVRAYSENGTDTAWSNISVFATESNSTGKMRVYFNTPVDHNVAQNVNAVYLNGTFNDTIKAYIDKAQNTLDVAVYNTDDLVIMNAINAAHNRGVQVRYIAEGGNLNTGLNYLDAAIPVLEKNGSLPGIMHNKFIIVDAESVNNSWILSGATNWTNGQLHDDPNDLIFIQDQALARAYTLEFEEMWGSSGAQPNASNAKFGGDKLDNTPHQFTIDGNLVECYFSPSDGTTSKIIETIESADHEMNFAVMAFTRDDISEAIQDVHGTFGKSASGVIEDVNGTGSEYSVLVAAGVPVYSTKPIPDIMHHKYCIIDRHQTSSDPIVLTGSHNWSTSAETTNDENTLIIHNEDIADMYYQEFWALYAEAVGIETISEFDMILYPVPADQSLHLEASLTKGDYAVRIFDLSGRLVESITWNGMSALSIDVSNLIEGMYIVKVDGMNVYSSSKVLIQH